MAARTKIFFDGGCRPGGMEIAVVLRGEVHRTDGLGAGDSMEAEWLALIAAIRLARRSGLHDVVFLGDSRMVIAQATGIATARGTGIRHLATFRDLIGTGPTPAIRYVKRSQNLAGIALDRWHDRIPPRPRRVDPA